jgi:hypothetical protein
MDTLGFALSLPDAMPNLLAVLGELFCWKFHEWAVQLGHIQPKDVLRYLTPKGPHFLRQRAAPWLFIHLSRTDSQVCAWCARDHLNVFLGSNPKGAAAQIRCVNPLGCRCVVIPIIGQWPEAERLRDQLSSQRGPLRLSEMDLYPLLRAEGNISEQDQLALRLLRAMLREETNPHLARQTYAQAIADPPERSHTLLQAAAYIRLLELLERSGDFKEAAHKAGAFLRTYVPKDQEGVLSRLQYAGVMVRGKRVVRHLLAPVPSHLNAEQG